MYRFYKEDEKKNKKPFDKKAEEQKAPVEVKPQKSQKPQKPQKSSEKKKTTKTTVVPIAEPQTFKCIPKKKKNKKTSEGPQKKCSCDRGTTSDSLDLCETAENKEASAFILEMMQCFTKSIPLPPESMHRLDQLLCEKTVSVFVNALNNCMQKICCKLVNSDSFQELVEERKALKKNVACQTLISFKNY